MRHRPLRTVVVGISAALIAASCAGAQSGVSVGSARPEPNASAPAAESVPDQPAIPDATDGSEPSDTAGTSSSVPPLEFDTCDDDDQLDCAVLDVPFDYTAPELGQIALFIKRRPADNQDKKVGSLLVNPGGPGFGGSIMADYASGYFGSDLLERFDIVAFDPRGTGRSEPFIDCIDEYDPLFGIDSSPDDAAEIAAVLDANQRFVDACVANTDPKLLEHISTPDVARDMDRIRAALGESTISYFGFSYGSELGATWLTMFPDTVRAAVLDGAADPNESAFDASMSQLLGFEASLNTFLDTCEKNDACAFRTDGDGTAALTSLSASIDAKPLEGRTPITNGVLFIAIAEAMYSESRWPDLETALGDAQNGKGDGLLELYDSYLQRNPDGSYDNSLEAFNAISCADDADRDTVAEVEADAAKFATAAPLLGPAWGYGFTCSLWPFPPRPKLRITGAGAPPVVVIGTTGDPATPLASTKRVAAALESGVLVVVDANQHTGYGVNDCVVDAVHSYLVDLEVPDDELFCD